MIDPPATLPEGNVESLCRFHPYQNVEFASHVHAMQAMLAGYAQQIYAMRAGNGRDLSGAPGNSPRDQAAPVGDFRNMDGLARELVRTLKSPSHSGYYLGAEGLRLAMDSKWCMRVSQAQWESCLGNLSCELLIIRGGTSHWCTSAGAMHMARIIRGGVGDAVDSDIGATIENASHWAVADEPAAVARLLYKFIDSQSRRDGVSAAVDRCPEALGIRPLDQFESIEEAMKRFVSTLPPSCEAVYACIP